MSVAGISSAISAIYQLGQSSSAGKIQNEFQQLGQDLQTGNLAQAQTDYSNLAQTFSAGQSSGPTSAAQAFSQLGKDLQSGNLTAAQQDFTQVQQDLQQGSALHHHHHHHGGGSTENSTSTASTSQPASDAASLFAELGQSLQAGNLSTAQQAYSTLQQDFLLSANSSGNLATTSSTGAFSLTA